MYIEQAYEAKTSWWRYIIGIVIIFSGWQIVGVLPLTAVALWKAGDFNIFMKAAENNFQTLGIDPNLFLFLYILMFTFGLLGIWFAARFIHEQPFKKLTTTRPKVDWGRIWFSFFMVVGINLVLFGIGYLAEPEALVWNFDPIPFFILCFIAIFLLPLQTSFEEYLFRGYFMQGLGVLAKNKWFPLLITSVFFGLLHGLNPEVEKLGYVMMVFYIGTGFLLGIMTLMDEGMELALGFHAGNNIFAALLVTTDWTAFQVPALFRDVSEPSAGFDIIAPVLILYPIYLIILARKYNWTNWADKLFGKVHRPPEIHHSEEI
ncbi:MAG TPA: CPBP family intramembrane glutamic endopeptidase [Salinimicrobium sp.]|nr:CPBP family intramembrane glutamic endopeptidase [Salinimicrobium sp.]